MAATAATPAKPAPEKLDPALIRMSLILVVGGLAPIFDTTIVSVALHTLSVKLGAPVTTVQWVTTSYLLALGIAVPLSTWGLARFGGRRLWIFSLAVFLAGSIGSSLAWNIDSLIAWWVVQGIGGGLMLPVVATLIFQAAGGKSLGRVPREYVAVVLVGVAAALLLLFNFPMQALVAFTLAYLVSIPFAVMRFRALDRAAE